MAGGGEENIGARALRRRTVPYWLLGPGIIWLAVFFVVPMFYMASLSLRTGNLADGYTFNWAWSNFTDSLSAYDTQ